MADCRLYIISPPSFNPDNFAAQLSDALSGGDIASFQLRLKDAEEETIIAAAKILMPLCHEKDVAFILNDNPALAKKIGADGVHLGQSDMTVKEARAMLGSNMIIGATCHNSKHLSMIAGEEGADYIAFGAFFPTKTKDVKEFADKAILKWYSNLFETPCVAIGGITLDNAAELTAQGADFIAVSSAIWNGTKGAKITVEKFNEILAQ